MSIPPQRNARIDIHINKHQKALISRAAKTTGQSLSDFLISSAHEKAEMILADQNEFTLSKDCWDKFVAALDRPERKHERLTKLMSERSVLECPK